MGVSRRDFLKVSAASGALLMAVNLPAKAGSKSNATNKNSEWTVYLKINKDNSIEIASPVQEMGQHMKTTGPMLLAEELDADWSLVKCTAAAAHFKPSENNAKSVTYLFADMNTGGSHALRNNWDLLRNAGAKARQLLITAASQVWKCSPDDIKAKKSFLYRVSNKNKLSFGDVAELASQLPPSKNEVTLKPVNKFSIIGKNATTVDIDDIVTGKPLFGMDMDYPGQLHAVVARCPHYKGSIKSFNDSEAKKVSGVLKVFKLDPINSGSNKILSEGVVIVAKTLWAAMKAKRLLKVEWNQGPWEKESAAAMRSEFSSICSDNAEGRVQKSQGDIAKGFEQAEKTIESEYFTPYFHHALMEPFNCIADVKDDAATIITGHQSPSWAANWVSEETGIDPMNIEVVSHRMGGGLGRRWNKDYVAEAAIISQKIKSPVKITWSREDEMEQDYFAPMQVVKIKAGLDKNQKIVAWHHRQAKKSGGARAECFPANLIPNYKLESLNKECGTPTGAWRGPGHLQFAFAVESMTDELAHAANIDPYLFRKSLYKGHGVYKYEGYGASEIDAARMWRCYEEVAKMSNWKEKRPEGVGLGIAGHFTFGSYAAFVVEVDTADAPNYRVTKCWGSIDCGLAVNPNHIANQMEGGFIDGLNAAMFNEAEIENGRVLSNNFHRLQTIRMKDSPSHFEVSILKNDHPPTGVGEPPTAPAAAALANALFDATGQRLRSLPLKLEA